MDSIIKYTLIKVVLTSLLFIRPHTVLKEQFCVKLSQKYKVMSDEQLTLHNNSISMLIRMKLVLKQQWNNLN